jgi:hypothetical protein
MPPRQKTHKQVPAKVTAYVDEGIKELIELLSSFNRVKTVESCEGYKGWAFIILKYGPPDTSNKEIVDFVTRLISKIKTQPQPYSWEEPPGGIIIKIFWMGICADPDIEIEFPSKHMKKVIDILKAIRPYFQGSIYGK